MNHVTHGQRRRSSRGQTVIELWIVLAVFALIGALVVFTVLPKLDAARQSRVEGDLKLIEDLLRQCHRRHGYAPDVDVGLAALVQSGCVDALPRDPWRRDYLYLFQDGVRVILSYGEDGEPGGTGIDADISRKLPPMYFRALDGTESHPGRTPVSPASPPPPAPGR